jgi:hypothetical protein
MYGEEGVDRMIIGEEFRVTNRLSSVVAWVMHRKGVNSGEIEEPDVPPILEGPDGDPSCLRRESETFGFLPAKLLSLLDRNHLFLARLARLYARLDAMIRNKAVDSDGQIAYLRQTVDTD